LTRAGLIGVVAAVRERRSRLAPIELTAEEAPAVHAIVGRLCVVADLPKPRIALEQEYQPSSWIVSIGCGRSQLHLTKACSTASSPSS
jgi:heat shock protein HtpX